MRVVTQLTLARQEQTSENQNGCNNAKKDTNRRSPERIKEKYQARNTLKLLSPFKSNGHVTSLLSHLKPRGACLLQYVTRVRSRYEEDVHLSWKDNKTPAEISSHKSVQILIKYFEQPNILVPIIYFFVGIATCRRATSSFGNMTLVHYSGHAHAFMLELYMHAFRMTWHSGL